MVYTECKVCSGETIEFLPQFELLKCKKCGFMFYKHQLDEVEVKKLYDKLYNQQDDYHTYRQQAAILKKGGQPHLGYNKLKVLRTIAGKKCKKIIEVGAGVGIVGNYLQKKHKEYTGIELDEEASKQANEVGVNVINASFELLKEIKNRDAVLAFEVLEHIDNLKHCLELMNNVLEPKGYIGLTVPNFEMFYNQSEEQQKKRLGQVGPPVHINFFTTDSLKAILPFFGFKPLYVRARPFPYLLWKRKSTYKKLWQSITGQFKGSTLICIAQKID
jgi:2-polyprenyl-3-methyl-5-hydroxy-6-metoxy-1,4-benzoquinol methylase